MQGLRTEENDRFLRYFEVVQAKAKEENSVFFMDFGQCDDIAFKYMKLDCLFGWLIPNEMADNFEELYLRLKVDDRWDDFCVWVTPNIENGKLSIIFE
ncbi:hypothetical protein HMPREF1635_06885 [Clostridiales bacterium S5-A14a]|nr:hypothetical protein HMPREF1635_06885 [Clostridiales bacterium S5-A14a]